MTANNSIPLFEIDWSATELKNVIDSVTRGSFWANGPYISKFEEELEEYMNVDHAVVFNSGTSALLSTLDAYGVGPGDEVIVPSFTFIATANMVETLGATPIFADIEDSRYGLDPAAVREQISADTRALLPIHYAGSPCYIHKLADIAETHELLLIEDAAEAQGAITGGQTVGTIGKAGILSFCQNKIIPVGEGGAVITDDEPLARRLELIRSHGRAAGSYFDSAASGRYLTMGYNFRMPDVIAAIGSGQMTRIEELITRRRRVAEKLSSGLVEIPGVRPLQDPPDGRHVYQLYTVQFADHLDRDKVIKYLADRNISSKVYFEPVHLTMYYRQKYGYEEGHLPTTEAVSKQVLSLPMHPNLSDEAIHRIVSAVADAVEAQT